MARRSSIAAYPSATLLSGRETKTLVEGKEKVG
jgi:hypothetical protein